MIMSLTHTQECALHKSVWGNGITSVTRVFVTEVFVTAWSWAEDESSRRGDGELQAGVTGQYPAAAMAAE